MTVLRTWLIVLLAVLLPIRGAVAGAMLCPPAGMGQASQMRALQAVQQHQPQMDDASPAVHPCAAHAQGSQDDQDGKQESKCNLCATFCSMTPLPSSSATVAAPLDLAAASFPELTPLALTFLSEGQERPPRST